MEVTGERAGGCVSLPSTVVQAVRTSLELLMQETQPTTCYLATESPWLRVTMEPGMRKASISGLDLLEGPLLTLSDDSVMSSGSVALGRPS